jgi:hypothetical protein
MIAIKDHYWVYDDNTFNCPFCRYVHFEKDWRPKWKEDGEKFQIECINHSCRRELIAFIKDGLMHVTQLAIERFVYRKKNKVKMKTRIDVQKHANRYTNVDIRDIANLIVKLNELIAFGRQEMIERMKSEVEQLEQGELPIDEPSTKPNRSRKKKEEIAPIEQPDETLDGIQSDDL